MAENNSLAETRHRRGSSGKRQLPHTDLDLDSFPRVHLASSFDDDCFNGETEKGGDIRQDIWSIGLLLFLYVLQGIPLGLTGAIPLMLQGRKVSYSEQAIFSLVHWPFSIKLLWAPLVDALYFKWFGRRKSWLIPTQYLIGAFLMVLSFGIHTIMRESSVDVVYLTGIFFALNFLAATQDIAVDGWALTMLSRGNVGWASTCNTVGQTAGFFLGNALFLALESADFCNKFLRFEPQTQGIVTFAGFLFFWGVIFFVTTTIVALLKPERQEPEEDAGQGIVDTYKMLVNVTRLPSITSYVIILLTGEAAFITADELTSLKLVEAGMPKEQLALFTVPLAPIQILLPLVISRYTHGPQPMKIWLKAYPYRILFGPLYALLVFWSHNIQTTPGEFPWYFYFSTLLLYSCHQVFVYMMFVSQMAFHAKISDPAIGGTYMTLLNTLSNLGAIWPSTVVLWLVDHVTWRQCDVHTVCSSDPEPICTEEMDKCSVKVDGFYVLILASTIGGLMWLLWKRQQVQHLDTLPQSAWKCS